MSPKTCLTVDRWLAEADLSRVVATDGQRHYTRAHLRRRVTAVCQQLLALPQRRWALCFDDSYLFTIALLAALHAGKIPVIPGHSRLSLLAEQRAEFDGLLSDMPLDLLCPQLRLAAEDDSVSEAAGDMARAAQLTGSLPLIEASAYLVLFTSGSGGQAKRVIKPVACMDREAEWLATLWGAELAGCHLLASVSHQHLYGLTFRIWLPMAMGLSADSRQILYSEQLSERHSPACVFISSPAFLSRLDRSLPAVACRMVISAGGNLPWPQAAAARQWFGHPVDEIYGSTETGVLAWRRQQQADSRWNLFPAVTVWQDVEQRWWARSALMPAAEGLPLDDLLAFDGQPTFRLCGRLDRIVKIEDKRISLSEIERRLMALDGVKDAAVVAMVRGGRSAVGAVVALDRLPDGPTLSLLKRQWRRELMLWLEPVALPRWWRVVQVIPHNSQSKRAWPQIQELFHVAG